MVVTLLSDDLRKTKDVFASRKLIEDGIDEELLSTPNEMIPVNVQTDAFAGLTAIVEA